MASREVVTADAVAWLSGQRDGSLANVVTSLPDMSETPHTTPDAYAEWFVEAARLCLVKTAPLGYAVFYQTDRRTNGLWIDKGALVHQAAVAAGVPMRWHKIVLRRENLQSVDNLRPTYTHLLCFSARGRPGKATSDVLHAGKPVYPNGMGLDAASFAVGFVSQHSKSGSTVVDPFVGRGTVLAVANALGLDAVGVDIDAQQVRHAQALRL